MKSKQKGRIQQFLLPGLFALLLSVLVISANPKTADAHCDTDACPICGDGIVGPGEECDDGNNVTEECPRGAESCTVCAADCTLQGGAVSICGDGVVGPGEQCDDGNDNNDDGCNDHCELCPRCGNGVHEPAAGE